jgi:cyanophycin synthetase
MRILKMQVLRGPNVWSNYRKKLIQMRLDLEDLEQFPTDRLPGFPEKLAAVLPGLAKDTCSEGIEGGFLIRMYRGTWMGHVIEHIALELQSLAGMETGYGRTRGTGQTGIYNVVYAYEVEEAGLYAGKAAFNLVTALIEDRSYDVSKDIEELKRLKRYYGLGPSTQSIVDEAVKRGIPWKSVNNSSTIQLGHGINQMKFRATITCNSSALAVDIAGNKFETKQLLESARIPVPKGRVCSDVEGLAEIINELGYPLVIKPLDGNHGKGITTDVRDWETAVSAMAAAQYKGTCVLVEQYITGSDYRILLVDNKLVAAAKRIPAHVIGDGISSIQSLIDAVNENPARGAGHENVLTKITVCRDTEGLLSQCGYTLETIPAEGETVFLKSTANLSTGGTATDVTDEIHPDNVRMFERVSRLVGLDVCGIDVMSPSIERPIREVGGAILELNAAPGFRMHLAPTEGKPRNVAAAVIDMLYPVGKPSRIPIIAVTGTNGKTTTTRLLAEIATKRGFSAGYTTTDGIYINGEMIEAGDTTGPVSGNIILSDPSVDFAVLETARGGILRSGLCYNECDVAIITNIQEDHLGLNDINTIEDLAKVKAVVARSVAKTGWAVLNADDEQCVKIADELDCNIAWFSLHENNPIIKTQIQNGLPAAIFENGYITIMRGLVKERLDLASEIPLTHGGKCDFMIANVLAAGLAAFVWGFSCGEIWNALKGFEPGINTTPGRLNMFDLNEFKVLVDYAHNPAGYRAIERFICQIGSERKIGIISGIGDRRDEDIRECAVIAARMFDHIIIRQEHSLRGSSEERINNLILEGIKQTSSVVSYEFIPDEGEATKRAISIAREGDLIVALSDQYNVVVDIIKGELEKDQMKVAV